MMPHKIPADVIERCANAVASEANRYKAAEAVLRAAGWPDKDALIAELAAGLREARLWFDKCDFTNRIDALLAKAEAAK